MSQIVETDGNVDRYIIQERIAGGGMGRIYRGVKKGIGGFEKPVVLKQLLPELAEDPELVNLFFREAHIHSALEHANIVHIIDLVVSERDYFIVLEYVRGTDLYRVTRLLRKRSELLPIPAALYIAKELFKALDYAHGRKDDAGRPLGIVHRDISPTNILLSAAGEVKITDFGIARSATDSSGFVNVRGKLAYMSPEQAVGNKLDHRTDLYSAGICTYEMLAGQRPLPTIQNLTDAATHFSQPIKPLTLVRPTCPPELDAIITKTLATRPQMRPQTAGEILAVLEQITNENQLFYSARKLADFLSDLLGPDPTTWSDTKNYAASTSRSGEIHRDDGTKRAESTGRRGLMGVEATSLHLRKGLRRRGLPSPNGANRWLDADIPSGPAEGAVMAAAQRTSTNQDHPVSSAGAHPTAAPSIPGNVGLTTAPPQAREWPPPPDPLPPGPICPPPPPPDSRDPVTDKGPDWVGRVLITAGLVILGFIVFWLVVSMAGL